MFESVVISVFWCILKVISLKKKHWSNVFYIYNFDVLILKILKKLF
jgi:hypothetical protein